MSFASRSPSRGRSREPRRDRSPSPYQGQVDRYRPSRRYSRSPRASSRATDRSRRYISRRDTHSPTHSRSRSRTREDTYQHRPRYRDGDRDRNSPAPYRRRVRPRSPGYRHNESPRFSRDRPPRPPPRGFRAEPPSAEFLAHRRAEREVSTYSVWPPSPKEPLPDTEPEKSEPSSDASSSYSVSVSRERSRTRHHKRRSTKKKRAKNVNSRRRRAKHPRSYDTDTESDRNRSPSEIRSSRRDKHSKSSRRHRQRRSITPDSDRESDQDRQSRRTRVRTKEIQDRSLSSATFQPLGVTPDLASNPELWVEKKVEPAGDIPVGPIPLAQHDIKMTERSYGGALLAGEGTAMAAYVQEGKRIPRRGEIGLNSDQIQTYEDVGYVMSGSRHHRMNAVRIRKENQVISAEEKRALLLFNQEEKAKRENKIINGFREIFNEKVRGKLDDNYVSHIIEPLPLAQSEAKLQKICKNENVTCESGVLAKVLQAAEGDLRRATMLLQSISGLHTDTPLTVNSVQEVAGIIPEDVIQALIQSWQGQSYDAIKRTVDQAVWAGYSAYQILNQIHDLVVDTPEWSSLQKARLAQLIGNTDKRISDGADEHLQLVNFMLQAAQLVT
ncbi:hypothetical protein IWQ61_009091 [Dispira simplex]|nr:hypothetical protein IWQ61_009091 [Dispira simplex]